MNGQPFHNQYKYRFGKVAALGLLLSCLFGVVACSDEEVPDPQLYTPEGVPYSYVSVGFSMAMNPVTKANPNGGEGGDGLEKGQSYENTVNNIHLFFYNVKDPTKDGKDGVNMLGDTAIVAHKYLEAGDFDYYSDVQATTNAIPVENLLVGNSYHVLAVVNAGKDLNYTKLGKLQSATVTSLYTKGTNGSYSNFLMASERDEDRPLTIYGNNSESNPASTEIYVERVTARVDYQTETGFSGEIKNSAGEKIATASITGAMLVNTLNAGAESFLLKRVTKAGKDFNTTNITYLGDETCTSDAIKAATNYVIDPYAATGKTETNYETATYFPAIAYGNASTWEKNELFQTTAITSGGATWNRIGYPKENVNRNGSKERSTGVVFRAAIQLKDVPASTTFFMWNGSIYKTLEKAMEAFDENGWKLVTSATYWNEINTYEDFNTKFIDYLKSDDPTGYKNYLREQVEDKTGTLSDEVKATLRWAYYMEHTNHYTSSDGVATVDVGTDVASGTTRRLLHDYHVSTYKDGICYYTYWIKHANDENPANDLENGDGAGVMEYAIVRNNVYKLGVKQIGSIGGDIPGDESLVINFSVKDWTLLNTEDVILNDNTQGGGE